MSIQCVLFDLDGTLLDTSYDFSYALNLTCQQFDVQPPSYNAVRNIVSQGSAALIRLAFPQTNEPQLEQYRQQFLKHYHNNIALHTQVFPGLLPGLVHLADKNIPWGIVTNKPADLTQHLLKKLDFPSAPRTIIAGDTLPIRKPNPEPMWLAAEQCGFAPESCIYLGDHPRDIEAGINAKMQTGAALFGFLSDKEIDEISHADFIFHTPYDISRFLKEQFN